MGRSPPIRLDVVRAKQRPADVVVTFEFWQMPAGWLHAEWQTASRIGEIASRSYRLIGNVVCEYGNELWDFGGAPRPPKRKMVKRRRGRR